MRCCILLALFTASTAYAASTSTLIKERTTAPSQWIRRGPAPDSHLLDLRFGLKQRGIAELEGRLLDVADPESPTYAQWLTKADVESYTSPRPESADAVRRWLAEHGINEQLSKRSSAGDWMAAPMTVKQAREVLGADFSVFENRDTGEQLVRTTQYSVPRHIDEHLDLVSPTTYFRSIKPLTAQKTPLILEELPAGFEPSNILGNLTDINNLRIAAVDAKYKKPSTKQSSKAVAAPVPAECNATAVTPTCLRKYYGTFDYEPKSPKKQIIGVSGFLEEYANYADFNQYLQTLRPEAAAANYTFKYVTIAGGGNNQSDPGVEANLDVQTVAGIAYPIKQTFYSNAGRPPFKPDLQTPTNTNEPYTTEFEYLLSLSDKSLPAILSTSYGDDEQTVPVAYQKRVCSEAAALGARGMTLFFSSGDSGVGPDGKCVSNDGKNKRMFLPAFPASCPFVTTVGGTQDFAPERTVGPSFYGGGGFSNTFKMPAYQKATVAPYVKSLGKTYRGLYNPNGRAYPDLSGQSLDYVIAYQGRFVRVSGTSASAPLVASIFALLNDQRLSKGKGRLGFINPALYSGKAAASLKDITIGSNNGCDTDGFPATKGWDAATGFGTPDFAKLSKAFA